MIFFLAVTSYKAYSQKNDSTNMISVSVDIIGKGNRLIQKTYKHPIKYDDFNSYFTLLKVSSNADTMIHFWTMLCSWEENWLSNNDSVLLYHPACDVNIPIEIKLKPHQSVKFYGILRPRSDTLQNNKFKLGFVMLEKSDLDLNFSSRTERYELMNKKGIYWSNEVELKDNIYRYKVENSQ